MRSGQQNKRGRGRNNNNNNGNRKGSNPLTRTYDSSGPDVKVRGTAQHIAEKYAQLARDAQSSGDRVMAENYLQHAEHYNRIIAAAQAQMQERYQREDRSDNSDRDNQDGSDDVDTSDQNEETTSASEAADGTGPQPVIEGVPAEVAIEEGEQPSRGERQPRRQPRQRRPRRPQNEASDESTEAKQDGSETPDGAVLAEVAE